MSIVGMRCLLQCKCNRSTLRREYAQRHRLDGGIGNCAYSCARASRRQEASDLVLGWSNFGCSGKQLGSPEPQRRAKQFQCPWCFQSRFWVPSAEQQPGGATSSCMAGANSPARSGDVPRCPALERWAAGLMSGQGQGAGLRRAHVFVPAVTQHGCCILYRLTIQYQYRGLRDAVVARPRPESPTNDLKTAVMGTLIHRETRSSFLTGPFPILLGVQVRA